jgi:hypothetical protein
MSRAHIEKEDHYLSYLADSLLSATDEEYLEIEFETVEPELSKPNAKAHYLAIAMNLARQFKVPEPVHIEPLPREICCIACPTADFKDTTRVEGGQTAFV